jgi:tetratricopeptide (TPR) repeat protein
MIPKKHLSIKLFVLQRVSFVFFGIIVCCVALEIILRLCGFILTSSQRRDNAISKQKLNAYRILCLGESTTAAFLGQKPYPLQLEEILNQRVIGIEFSVINKGAIAMNSSFIVSKLDEYLKEYNPDMVIAMMGINDCGYTVEKQDTGFYSYFNHSRLYKFLRIVWEKYFLRAKDQESPQIKISQDKIVSSCIGRDCPADSGSVVKEGDNSFDYQALGMRYKDEGKFSEAKESFRRQINIDPAGPDSYFQLGCLYEDEGKFSEAQMLYIKAIKLAPKTKSALVYRKLGELCEKDSRYQEAETYFKKSILLDPLVKESHERIGLFYRNRGSFALAEEAYKKALEIDPTFYFACRELGMTYKLQNKFKEAEKLFSDFIKVNPENDRIYQDLIQLYDDIGDEARSYLYREKAKDLKQYCRAKITANNYNKLKDVLGSYRIRLVCVQYPMRDINMLKSMFVDSEGVIFVDNEKFFKDAVKESNFNEYFIDKMFVDFGHCTSKGNKLLAENIAKAIMQEVFN